MKVALVADVHFGLHGNSDAYAKSIDDAFAGLENCLKKNNVETLVFLGDLFDSRFAINQETEDKARKCLERLENEYIELIMLPGNHDCYFANTIRINSMVKYGRLAQVITEPMVIKDKILALPWICEDNETACLAAIQQAKTPYCLGHLDIYGASMNNRHASETGLKPALFKNFGKVFSGHFHSRQTLGNIEYIGSMVQTTFADSNEKRGLTILDTDAGTAEFIELNGMKHIRIPLAEDFDASNWDIANNAIELLVPDNLWGDDRLIRKAEKAIMDAGVNYFAGSKKDLRETEKKIENLPPMKRDETIMDYMQKYVQESNLENKDLILKELKRLYDAVA